MATEAQINAVVDIVVRVFGGDTALFEAHMTRAKLETELAEIESEIRNKQSEAESSATDFGAEIDALVADRNAKQAEIDALG